MNRPCEVHVDITTTITNPVTGFSAMFCTQQTMTTPPDRIVFNHAADVAALVCDAHTAQLRAANGHPS